MLRAFRLRNATRATLIGAAVLAAATTAASGSRSVAWTQFHFDASHTGFNPFETTIGPHNVRLLALKWQAQLGRLVDFSSPAVVSGVAYIGSSEGRLWAYPLAGCGRALCTRPLWRSVELGQIVDSPTVSGGMVFVGSQRSRNSNAGELDAFAARGCGRPVCAPLWQGTAGPKPILQSSPAVSAGLVFVGDFGGDLDVFDARGCGAPACAPLWRGVTGGSIESTPTVAGGSAFVGSDDGHLYAFDVRGCGAPTCAPRWTGALQGPAFESTPAVAGGTVFIGSQHGLAAFDVAGCGAVDCTPRWQAVERQQFFNGSPAVANGRVYLGLEDGLAVYAAAGCGHATCSPLWLDFGSGAQAAVVSSPAIADGVVYAGRNTGEVLAWNAAPCGRAVCSNVWSGRTGDPLVTSSPAVVDGTVYVGGADALAPQNQQGRLYAFTLR